MTIKSGLISLLAGESSITDICGTRIYVNKAPQGADLPHVIVTLMSAEHNTTMDGGSNLLRFVDFDLDCYADRSVTADSLATAVRVFIDDYSGTAGSETIGAVIINDESDEYEPPRDASDKGRYVVTIDLTIHYTPA